MKNFILTQSILVILFLAISAESNKLRRVRRELGNDKLFSTSAAEKNCTHERNKDEVDSIYQLIAVMSVNPIPEEPSNAPINIPSGIPSAKPSVTQTIPDSNLPSSSPSNEPSMNQTNEPSNEPSMKQTNEPSNEPSMKQTNVPSNEPSMKQTNVPSNEPSMKQTNVPSNEPSMKQTNVPSNEPTKKQTNVPSNAPSNKPSASPKIPSMMPSPEPSKNAIPSSSPVACTDRAKRAEEILFPISGDNIFDIDTAAGKAYEWILNEDMMQLCPSIDCHFIQRYVLAVLYYATEGDEWINCSADSGSQCTGEPNSALWSCNPVRWLSEENECNWCGNTCYEDNQCMRFFEMGKSK